MVNFKTESMTSSSPVDRNIYEWPSNPRIRSFLRYENLINTTRRRMEGDDDVAIFKVLCRLLALSKSNDFKSELAQQLAWQRDALAQFSQHRQTDQALLDDFIHEHDDLLERFHSFKLSCAGYYNNDLLSNIFLRLSLPSGPCSFDVPQLRFWQQQPAETRKAMLGQWLAPFLELSKGIDVCLGLTRKSGEFEEHTAKNGFFSANMPPVDVQMLRVRVSPNSRCYPQMSMNRQMLSMHFFSIENWAAPPQQVNADLSFEIAYCSL